MAATVDVTGNTIVKFRVTVTKPRNIQWPAPPPRQPAERKSVQRDDLYPCHLCDGRLHTIL